jgi:hypothetical protein
VEKCNPLVKAIEIIKEILSNPNTNPMIFGAIRLLNEQFIPQKDSQNTIHLVPTNVFPNDFDLLGKELISLLPKPPFLFFQK